MKIFSLLPFLSVLLSFAALADESPLADSPSPVGCYSFASGDGQAAGNEFNDARGKEICLKSDNVRQVGEITDGIYAGTFEITIRDGGEVIKTYHMTSLLVDGSGSHVDFLFAEKLDTLKNVDDPDGFVRERRGPVKNVVFYVLFYDRTDDGGLIPATGDLVGKVTIDGKTHTLWKK